MLNSSLSTRERKRKRKEETDRQTATKDTYKKVSNEVLNVVSKRYNMALLFRRRGKGGLKRISSEHYELACAKPTLAGRDDIVCREVSAMGRPKLINVTKEVCYTIP